MANVIKPQGWAVVNECFCSFLRKHRIHELFPNQYELFLQQLRLEPKKCQDGISRAFRWEGNNLWFRLNFRWRLYCKFVLCKQYPACFEDDTMSRVSQWLDFNCSPRSYQAARRKYLRLIKLPEENT